MKWIEKVFLSAAKHKSTILTVTSIVGVVGTMILSARAGIRSEQKLEELKENTVDGEEPTHFDQIKVVAPEWIFPTAVAAATIYNIIKNKQVNDKKIAGIAAFAAGAVRLNYEQQKMTKETLSASKAQAIHDGALVNSINEKKLANINNEDGEEVVCFIDSFSGLSVLSTMPKFDKMVEDAVNLYEGNGGYLAFCDIFYMLDEDTGYSVYKSAIGEEVGFSKEMYRQCCDDGTTVPDLDIKAVYIGEKNGIRVFRMDYSLEPDWGFDQY